MIATEPIRGPPRTLGDHVVAVLVILTGLFTFATVVGTVSAMVADRMRSGDPIVSSADTEDHLTVGGWIADATTRARVRFLDDDVTKIARTALCALTIERLDAAVYTCAEIHGRERRGHRVHRGAPDLSLRALVVALAALVVACGPAPRAAAPKPQPPTYAVATSGDYAPFSAWEGDRPTGFAPALLDAFAQSTDAHLSWTRFRWADVAEGMREGRWDVVADGITVRPERSIAGSFTIPIARGGAVLLLRRPAWASREAGIHELDRKELRVIVNRGGHLEHVARALLHDADVRAIPDNVAVRDAFARGEADAAMTNTFEAPRWSAGLDGVEALGPLTNDVTALWVGAGREEIARRLDEWLLAAEHDGRLRELRARLLGPGGGDATATPIEALLAATAERLALMPSVAAAKKRTGSAVEDAAQEERVLVAAGKAVAGEADRARRPPPRADAVDGFFRAQIAAAKEVQVLASPVAADASYDLARDLRPAIARISARMAFLVVRVDATPRNEVRAAARRALADTALAPATVDRIADSIAALQ